MSREDILTGIIVILRITVLAAVMALVGVAVIS